MATLEEQFTIALPFIMSLVATVIAILIARHFRAFDKATNQSSLATFNIGSIDKEVKEIKDRFDETQKHMDGRLDVITAGMEKRDEKLSQELRRMWERVDLINSSMRLAEYRLDRVEKAGGSTK